jgi:hypothetical protein
MDIKAQRLEILQQVENGEITLDEASRWLAALDLVQSKNGSQPQIKANATDESQVSNPDEENDSTVIATDAPYVEVKPVSSRLLETVQAQPAGDSEEYRAPFWRGWWLILFIPGLLLLAAAVNWMVQGYMVAGLSWGFWLSFIPFTIGVLMIWIGWEVRIARWFHLHITQKNKPGSHEINISFPLPVGLVSWGIRHFGHFASPMRGKNMDGVLEEINQAVASDGPMHIFVDDDDGDQVEIWIDGPRSK